MVDDGWASGCSSGLRRKLRAMARTDASPAVDRHEVRASVKSVRRRESESATATAQLGAFIEKFDPKDQKLIRAVRSAVRKRFPTANELVYDNYNFLVIGYSPTERPSDAIISIAARANGVGLCFIHGASLPDPKKLLLGSGTQTRF